MCFCCCPPAVNALLYLWIRSGFSKEAVAGALTFFPPDPPLYKFARLSRDGRELPDIDDEDDEDADVNEDEEEKEDLDQQSLDESELGTFQINTKSSHKPKNDGVQSERRASKQIREKKEQIRREETQEDPILAMTERSKRLRSRAKHRAKIDSADVKNGVTYRFDPDFDSLGNLPSFDGTVLAVKIGPQAKTKTHIAALLYKLPSKECNKNTKTIIYSHGNATDVGAMAGLQCLIAKNIKCHVLVYDYSGYGESGGLPMEKNTYRDVKMVYEWVVANVAAAENSVILYGQSVGSGPSVWLASRRENVGGLILHSPFTSGMRVLTPSRALACLDIFPNIDRIKNVECPVFIIHGKDDSEVGFEHGLALQAAVPEDCKTDPWWVPHKGHNDIVDGPNVVEYINRLNKFVRSLSQEN